MFNPGDELYQTNGVRVVYHSSYGDRHIVFPYVASDDIFVLSETPIVIDGPLTKNEPVGHISEGLRHLQDKLDAMEAEYQAKREEMRNMSKWTSSLATDNGVGVDNIMQACFNNDPDLWIVAPDSGAMKVVPLQSVRFTDHGVRFTIDKSSVVSVRVRMGYSDSKVSYAGTKEDCISFLNNHLASIKPVKYSQKVIEHYEKLGVVIPQGFYDAITDDELKEKRRAENRIRESIRAYEQSHNTKFELTQRIS